MPPSPTLIARDARILAGHRAGRSLLDIARAEGLDPAVVRRVLRDHGIEPGPLRRAAPPAPPPPACLRDLAWLRAEYATKGAHQIAEELGCPRDAVYEALHAAGIPPRVNGHGPRCEDRITPEQSERAVSLYAAGSTAEQVAEAVGLTADQVGRLVEEAGVKRSRSEAARLAHPPAGAPRAGPHDWPAELQAEVLDRYAQGQSGELISELLGLPASGVYRLLKEQGVLRPRGGRGPRAQVQAPVPAGPAVVRRPLPELLPPEEAAEALARYAAGEAPAAIAVLLGVPKSRVYGLLKERGVLRSRSEAGKLRALARREGAKRRELGPAREE